MKPIFYTITIFAMWSFFGCFNSGKVTQAPQQSATTAVADLPSFYDLQAKSIDGDIIKFDQYKGKNVIVLNVASKCGYTPQYEDWQKYYDLNKENTVVLGFPCNQFLGQEPGNAVEIETFCQKNYGVTFQMFDKVDVKGDKQDAVYQWLTNASKNGWNSDVPSWNFCKYLIDENGKLTHYFGSKIKPESPEFIAALK